MLTIIDKVLRNNGKLLPQSPFPLRYPKKNHPVTHCQLSPRLHQEPLPPPQSIINVGGLTGLQLLSSSRHLSESVPQASAHRPPLATIDPPPAWRRGRTNCVSFSPEHSFQKSSPRIPCVPRASGSVQPLSQ